MTSPSHALTLPADRRHPGALEPRSSQSGSGSLRRYLVVGDAGNTRSKEARANDSLEPQAIRKATDAVTHPVLCVVPPNRWARHWACVVSAHSGLLLPDHVRVKRSRAPGAVQVVPGRRLSCSCPASPMRGRARATQGVERRTAAPIRVRDRAGQFDRHGSPRGSPDASR